MTLKTLEYRVTDESRDKGKMFILVEMPAAVAEKWAARFLCALMNNSRSNLPMAYMVNGMAGLFTAGLPAMQYLKYEDAEPLMDTMWQHCVRMPGNAKDPSRVDLLRPVFDEEIEDWQTRVKIRAALIGLHFDFSEAVAPYRAQATATTEDSSAPTQTVEQSTSLAQ
jgi:hypothetical protein